MASQTLKARRHFQISKTRGVSLRDLSKCKGRPDGSNDSSHVSREIKGNCKGDTRFMKGRSKNK